MRRPSQASKDRPFQDYDFLNDIDPDRLKLIGAIILAWNWTEGALDTSLAIALELHPDMWVEVTSRFSGLDEKTALLKRYSTLFAQPDEQTLPIRKALNAFENLKKYRDGVVHARVIDPNSDTADTAQRKGRTDEVLVSRDALNWLYDQLSVLRREMDEVVSFFYYRWLATTTKSNNKRQQALRDFQDTLVRLRGYQEQREYLPPPPVFPEQLESHEASADSLKPRD
jgi:hypothetical protein